MSLTYTEMESLILNRSGPVLVDLPRLGTAIVDSCSLLHLLDFDGPNKDLETGYVAYHVDNLGDDRNGLVLCFREERRL